MCCLCGTSTTTTSIHVGRTTSPLNYHKHAEYCFPFSFEIHTLTHGQMNALVPKSTAALGVSVHEENVQVVLRKK